MQIEHKKEKKEGAHRPTPALHTSLISPPTLQVPWATSMCFYFILFYYGNILPVGAAPHFRHYNTCLLIICPYDHSPVLFNPKMGFKHLSVKRDCLCEASDKVMQVCATWHRPALLHGCLKWAGHLWRCCRNVLCHG